MPSSLCIYKPYEYFKTCKLVFKNRKNRYCVFLRANTNMFCVIKKRKKIHIKVADKYLYYQVQTISSGKGTILCINYYSYQQPDTFT